LSDISLIKLHKNQKIKNLKINPKQYGMNVEVPLTELLELLSCREIEPPECKEGKVEKFECKEGKQEKSADLEIIVSNCKVDFGDESYYEVWDGQLKYYILLNQEQLNQEQEKLNIRFQSQGDMTVSVFTDGRIETKRRIKSENSSV